MAAHKQSRSAPRVFGNYLLYEEIARGGMARVFRAGLRGLAGFEKQLVLKQILPELASDPRFVELFVREATTVVGLSHPHIVPVYDLGLVDGVYFLSMEHVAGVTLASLLRDGPMPPELVAHLGVQVADALAYAHGVGSLVHRDVTPRNIMIDAGGHARLLDFGIAAPTKGVAGEEVFGSPGYMSPEQARAEAVDGRSDVFSLSAVLYRATTGVEPFRRESDDATWSALMAEERPRLSGSAPDALASIVEQALALDPQDRPDAEAFGKRLRAWLSGEHPEGVAAQLGRRVQDCLARDAAPAPAEGGDARAESEEPGQATARVETLATQPAFAAILRRESIDAGDGPGTRPIARARSPVPAVDGAPADGSTPPESTAEAESAPAAVEGTNALGTRSPSYPSGHDTRGSTSRRLRPWLWVAAVLLTAAAVARFSPGDGAPVEPAPPIERHVAPDAAAPSMPSDAGAEQRAPLHAAADAGPTDTAVADSSAAVDARVSSPAALTLTARPWAAVLLDGRAIGTTPLRSRRVRAGRHSLVFENSPLGRRAQLVLHLAPGQRAWVEADLSRDPPRVRQR